MCQTYDVCFIFNLGNTNLGIYHHFSSILCYFWRQNCLKTSILAPWATLINRTHGTYERLYWLFWISLPTALTKRFRVPLWGPKMKRLLVSYRYQIFFAQTSAETYCSTQRIWQSDQFPPLFFAIEKKVCRFLTASKSYLQSCQRKSFKIKVFWSFLLICFYLCVVWSRFFTDAKSYIRRTFQIPWTLYESAQKIF